MLMVPSHSDLFLQHMHERVAQRFRVNGRWGLRKDSRIRAVTRSRSQHGESRGEPSSGIGGSAPPRAAEGSQASPRPSTFNPSVETWIFPVPIRPLLQSDVSKAPLRAPSRMTSVMERRIHAVPCWQEACMAIERFEERTLAAFGNWKKRTQTRATRSDFFLPLAVP